VFVGRIDIAVLRVPCDIDQTTPALAGLHTAISGMLATGLLPRGKYLG
jgi:hypothetical protein